MDKDRQIRFLYPPLFFLAFLVSAILLDPQKAPMLKNLFCFSDAGAEKIFSIVAAGGVAILVLGFLIGTLTTLMLRLMFFIAGGRRYEAVLSNNTLQAIWHRIGATQDIKNTMCGWRQQAFYAGVTFDHAILPKGIHLWLMRRWSAFNISINSCFAVLLALAFAYRLNICFQKEWLIVLFTVALFLVINAIIAWNESMAMVEFQATCFLPAKNSGTLSEGGATETENDEADDT